MKIRTLVVDDEPRARRRMRRLLGEHPDIEIVGEASDGDEAVSMVLSLRPAVVFLDVNMPGQTGLQAVAVLHKTLPEAMRPLVIFTTAHEQHAVEAFSLEGLDYLLKPVEKPRLAEALRRIRKVLYAVPAAAAGIAAPQDKVRLSGWKRGKIIPLDAASVGAITVEDTITFLHTPDGKFQIRMNLQELESKLSDRFARVSRSAIVNLDWLQALIPGESGTYVAKIEAPISLDVMVSRRRARALRQILDW